MGTFKRFWAGGTFWLEEGKNGLMKKVAFAYAKPPPMVNVKRGSGNVIGLKSNLIAHTSGEY